MRQCTAIDDILLRRHTQIVESACTATPNLAQPTVCYGGHATIVARHTVLEVCLLAPGHTGANSKGCNGVKCDMGPYAPHARTPECVPARPLGHHQAVHPLPGTNTREVQLQLSSPPHRYTGHHLVHIANQMQTAAQLEGHVSRQIVLRKVSITAATSTAFGRMGKPLRPYRGITCHAGVSIPTARERRVEVRAQAEHTTVSTHQELNVPYFQATHNPNRVRVRFQHGRHLPLPLLGNVLHQGIDPTSVSSMTAYYHSLSVSPLLTPATVSVSILIQGSRLASLDQVPQALLSQLGHGGIHRVQAQLQLMHARLPSVSLRAVQMGIDKGKGISHLYKGQRPVPLTSPVPRVESRVAQCKLASTLELDGRYTQALFSYRREVRPAFMALALRALRTHTLLTPRHVATVDWDESDVYVRRHWEDQSHLNGLMRPMWDFGPWAAFYFSRICI